MKSCVECRWRVYLPGFQDDAPARPGELRTRPFSWRWYCDIRLRKVLPSLGLDSEFERDRIYMFVDEEQLAPALIGRSMLRMLNDPYTRRRGDLVYFGELSQRMERYGNFRPWARSRAELLRQAMEEEVCRSYWPRGTK